MPLGWVVFSAILTVATIRSSMAFFGLFSTVTMAFLMNAIGYYNDSDENFIKAGGYFGLVASLLAWYIAFAEVWNGGNSYIHLPLGQFPWAERSYPHV